MDQCIALLQQLQLLNSNGSEVEKAAEMQSITAQLSGVIAASNLEVKSAVVAQENALQTLLASLKTAAAKAEWVAAKHLLLSVNALCSQNGTYASSIQENLAALAESGAVEIAVQIFADLLPLTLQAATENAFSQQLSDATCAVCGCLCALAYSEANCVKLGTLGVGEMARSLLASELVENAVRRAACAVLKELCHSWENRIRFGASGACQFLLQQLSYCAAGGNYLLAMDIGVLLACLARQSENQRVLLELEAIPAIMQLLRDYMDIDAVVLGLCALVADLCLDNHVLQARFGEAGVCSLIAQVLHRHQSYPEIAYEACGAFFNMIQTNGENATRILQAGGEVAVARMLADFVDEQHIVCRAAHLLSRLCQLPGSATALLASGCVEVVGAAMNRHLNDATIVQPLSFVFCRFAMEDEGANVAMWGPRALVLLGEGATRHLANPQAAAAVCHGIACVQNGSQNQLRLRPDDRRVLCRNVLAVLLYHEQNIAAVARACRAAAALVKHSESAEWLCDNGLLEALHRSMRFVTELANAAAQQGGQVDPVALEDAVGVWKSLAAMTMPQPVAYLCEHPQVLDMIRQFGQRNQSDHVAASNVCEAIAALAKGSEQVSALCTEAGLSEFAVRVLELHLPTQADDAVHFACVAIGSLTNVPANQELFRQAGACRLVSVALARCIGTNPACFACVQTVCSLAYRQPENAALLGDAGACEAVTQTLAMTVATENFVVVCCQALFALCLTSGTNADRCFRAGVSQAFVHIFATHTPSSRVMTAAIAALSALAAHAGLAQLVEFGQAGLCAALITALTSHVHSGAIAELAGAAIRTLCASQQAGNEQRFLRCGALDVLNSAKALHTAFGGAIDEAIAIVTGATPPASSDE